MSLFRKIGLSALESVVQEFYGRVLADAELQGFFAHTDMHRQTRHQVAFLSMVLGGAQTYAGRSIRNAHEGRGIQDHHFDKVAGHLKDSLERAGVEAGDVTTILGMVGGLRGEVVT